MPEPLAEVAAPRVADARLELDRVTLEGLAAGRLVVVRLAAEPLPVEVAPPEPEERRLAAFAPLLLFGADFFPVARVLPDRVPDRLVAMLPLVARSMPSTPCAARLIVQPAKNAEAVASKEKGHVA